GRPAEALPWAERAREIDPAQSEPWSMAIGLLWAMERDEEAVALCAEAAGRFPHLRDKHDRLRAQLLNRVEGRRLREELSRRELETSDRLDEARQALHDQRDADVVALCREVLSAFPGRVDALQMAAYASQRLGRIDEAIELYQSLAGLQPSNAVWSE